eukprot:gene14746-20794_t
MATMEQVEVTPATLQFKFQLNKQLLATISIKNPLDQRLAFKVKTTAPKTYVVRPSTGFVAPNSTAMVHVLMASQKDFPIDGQHCSDKFMVQTTPLADGEEIRDSTFLKGKAENLRENRLKVMIEPPEEPFSAIPEDEADEGLSEKQQAVRDAMKKLVFARLTNQQLVTETVKAFEERNHLQKMVDMVELQGGRLKSDTEAAGIQFTPIHAAIAAILKARVLEAWYFFRAELS